MVFFSVSTGRTQLILSESETIDKSGSELLQIVRLELRHIVRPLEVIKGSGLTISISNRR